MQMVEIRIPSTLTQVFITGFELVDKLLIERSHTQPDFAGGHIVNVQLRAIARYKVLEQLVGNVQIFLELLPALFGIFTEHRHRTFVFTRRKHLKIHVVFF
ncbi:hypothetical protein D3C77_690280 [compost metagenome]